MRRMRASLTALVFLFAFAACGSDNDGRATVVEPEATVEGTKSADDIGGPALPLETELVEDIVYHPTEEPFTKDSGLVDIITPTEGGPYPTVVVFHGDPRAASKEWHRSDAEMIAERGRVVFLPAWGDHAGASRDLINRELACAVSFAREHTEEYGGDSDDITLYGLSAGGNAVLMAGLGGFQPLDTCTAAGPAVQPQALVPIDADWLMGGSGDAEFSEDPEAFYSITPYRHLDGSQDVVIHVLITNDPTFVRPVGPDPSTSWLSYRHPDIDLVAELDAGGYLDDGELSLGESGEWAYQVLLDAGYNATLAVIPNATHQSWGTEGTQVVVETVLGGSS